MHVKDRKDLGYYLISFKSGEVVCNPEDVNLLNLVSISGDVLVIHDDVMKNITGFKVS